MAWIKLAKPQNQQTITTQSIGKGFPDGQLIGILGLTYSGERGITTTTTTTGNPWNNLSKPTSNNWSKFNKPN